MGLPGARDVLRLALAAALLAVAAAPDAAEPPAPAPWLAARVDTLVSACPGRVFLFARNLDTGASFGRRADERVRAASTIKLAILVEAHARVAAALARWDEPLTLTAAAKVEGAGVLFELHPGLVLTLRDAVRLMIVLSDNTATNLVIDRLGADAVNERMDAMGLPGTRLMRKIGGGGDSRAGLDPASKPFGLGASTPREMVKLLETIERGDAVSKEASADMVALLEREQYPDGIGRTLRGVEVASKSGALDHLRSDVGIVYAKTGRVAMAITVDEMPDVDWTLENPGLLAISALSVALTDGLGSPR